MQQSKKQKLGRDVDLKSSLHDLSSVFFFVDRSGRTTGGDPVHRNA